MNRSSLIFRSALFIEGSHPTIPVTPRAGMLGTIAGVAIVWIAMIPSAIIFANPIIGLPALFVPYPYAAGDHQYHNALFLKEKGLAWSYRESPSYARNLLAILDDDLEEKSRGLMGLGNKGAAAAIIDDIEERLDVS